MQEKVIKRRPSSTVNILLRLLANIEPSQTKGDFYHLSLYKQRLVQALAFIILTLSLLYLIYGLAFLKLYLWIPGAIIIITLLEVGLVRKIGFYTAVIPQVIIALLLGIIIFT